MNACEYTEVPEKIFQSLSNAYMWRLDPDVWENGNVTQDDYLDVNGEVIGYVMYYAEVAPRYFVNRNMNFGVM